MPKTPEQDLTDGDHLMKTSEVAEYLNVTPYQVRVMARDGRLNSIRLGDPPKGHLRFEPEDVRAFVHQQRKDS